jgi:prepilin-type N-terminal cleavage/methylation domain-containing protein
MSRGFTLIEMMICSTIGTIVVAGVGMFYLEARVSTARTEADVLLNRDASLALEWIARDASGADQIESEARGVAVVRGEERIRWEIGERGLTRIAGSQSRIIAPRATELKVEAVDRGHRFQVKAERKLLQHRSAKIVRSVFVGRRR